MIFRNKDGFKAVKDSFKNVDGFTYLEGEELFKIQELLFGMLKDLIKVLDKQHIFYTLSGGSVLGAIRHQGFIPWDDDIDINMPRRSFEQFKRVFDRELGDKYVLHAPEFGHGYGFSVAHFGKKGTVYKIFNNIDLPDEDCCIGFDIFVLENTFNSRILRNLHGFLCLLSGYLLNCRKVYDYYPVVEKQYGSIPQVRDQFHKKYRIGKLLCVIPLDRMAAFTYRIYSLCKNNHSRYVTIPSGRKHFFGELNLRKDMCKARKASFRDLQVNIPAGTDGYMKQLYGDGYMTIPPKEKREQHPIIRIDYGD